MGKGGEVIVNKKTPQHIYRKLFTTYTIIIVCIVSILELYFVTNIKEQTKEINLENNQRTGEDAVNYIKHMGEISSLIQHNLYESEIELWDTVYFLEDDIETYLKKGLDIFSSSDEILSYNSSADFSNDSFSLNENIQKIIFLSYNQKVVTEYNRAKQSYRKTYEKLNIEELKKQLLEEENSFSFLKEIRNPNTLDNIGCLIINYSNAGFKSDYNKKSNLIVFHEDGKKIYDSEGNINTNLFYDETDNLLSQEKIEKKMKWDVYYQGINDFHVISYMKRENVSEISIFLKATILLIGIILFIGAELFVHLHLKRLTKRLNIILDAMVKVTKGDLTVCIQTGKEEDELDIISEHFNKMCKDLDRYIQKSYLAEIEQKSAEMNALQSQINPHFLYNTLEAIRMKAICNGDREVGKMLYSLAVIFRSQIKEDNIINLAKELHYCEKYLELFEFRYQNKFNFIIECNQEWMDIPVIKFIVQPVIENYFVHGIRLEANDNFLKICVKKQEKTMSILVEDNGTGMTLAQIEEMEKKLKSKKNSVGSIGIINVHRRMEATYGEGYGVYLERNSPSGLRVILKFLLKEEEQVV